MTHSCVRNIQNVLHYTLSALTKNVLPLKKRCAITLVHVVALLQKNSDGILTVFLLWFDQAVFIYGVF